MSDVYGENSATNSYYFISQNRDMSTTVICNLCEFVRLIIKHQKYLLVI